jgi:hypothetical protein
MQRIQAKGSVPRSRGCGSRKIARATGPRTRPVLDEVVADLTNDPRSESFEVPLPERVRRAG